jgi:hypothetical protein
VSIKSGSGWCLVLVLNLWLLCSENYLVSGMYIIREGVSGPGGYFFFPYIFASGIVLCIDRAVAWTLNVS